MVANARELSFARAATPLAVVVGLSIAFPLVGIARQEPELVIPQASVTAEGRLASPDDMLTLRYAGPIALSPDGRRFAVLIHQRDPVANDYRTGWFMGSIDGGELTYLGSGGTLTPDSGGLVAGPAALWSPDAKWVAYKLARNGAVQLWRSSTDGGFQQQITDHAGDVLDFAWSADGTALHFSADPPRADLRLAEERRQRRGYQYDEDLYVFSQFMMPPWPASVPGGQVWTIGLDDGSRERPASRPECEALERAQSRKVAGMPGAIEDMAMSPVLRADGARVWLQRARPFSLFMRLVATLPSAANERIECAAQECSGAIQQVWWSKDGTRVMFFRRAGVDFSSYEFFEWVPANGTIERLLVAPDDDYSRCSSAADDQLICVRETPTRPAHIVAIDMRFGTVRIVADINPEFQAIRLGRVERIEWDTPRFGWNEPGGALAGLYPRKAYGYILYPPDFDASKKYPVFIDPYYAKGFESSVGFEHAQHAYAASGFVVLKTTFPSPIDPIGRLGAAAMKEGYSAQLDFPHMTLLMESTVAALDALATRPFIDQRRVGIGGVSHGSFIPLYMMQKHDRIAAISVSTPGWGPLTGYYDKTQLARKLLAGGGGYEEWEPKPDGAGREFWRRIDIADHIEELEAPILMQLSAYETFGMLPLIRGLADAQKPYDAYIFPNETHIKWQPSHLHAIVHRNLDWFRFWLQDYEDPDPAKADQYDRWRDLRKRHNSD